MLPIDFEQFIKASENDNATNLMSMLQDAGNVHIIDGRPVGTITCDNWQHHLVDKNDELIFWQLAKLFQLGRTSVIFHSSALSDGKRSLVDESTTFFVLVVQYRINDSSLRNAMVSSPVVQLKTVPLTFTNSSIIMETTITATESGESCGTLKFKYVMVDKTSRKSKALPEWFKSHFQNMQKSDSDTVYTDVILPADVKTFVNRFIITDSFVDVNQHTNHSVYFKLTLDTVKTAVQHRVFKSFPFRISQTSIKEANGLYIKESILGDVVDVCVWEATSFMPTIHSRIYKGNTIIFKSTIVFSRSKIDTVAVSKL